MNRTASNLYFTGRGMVEIKTEPLPDLRPGQALVKTEYSAISAGTEMLIYRDQFPRELPLDDGISTLAGEFQYPLRYGYAAVGKVIAAGQEVESAWLGRRVFAFQPHGNYFVYDTADLVAVPEDIPPEAAIFLPNMETALNFVMDGAPLVGEQVVVFGQGVVGLLTTALLAHFPLNRLATLDRYPLRRQASLDAGAGLCLDPADLSSVEELIRSQPSGADLVFELSGSPDALNLAIDLAGFASRIVIGSWYGQKRASLDLGGKFHRNRIQLISSQVTTIAPALSGRWNKQRRFELAWEMLRLIQPERWITHRYRIAEASAAYSLLDRNPQEAIQIIFDYV